MYWKVTIGILLVVALVVVWVVLRRRKSSGASTLAAPKQAQPQQLASAYGPSGGPARVVFGRPDSPRLEIGCCAPLGDEACEPLALSPVMVGHLLTILRYAAVSEGGVLLGACGTVAVRLAPELAAGLAEGSESMAHTLDDEIHSIAPDANGKLVDQGRVMPMVQPAALAAAVWHVLAAHNARRFLPSIATRLDGVERRARESRGGLEGERLAKLLGAVGAFKDVAGRLDGDFGEDTVSPLAEQLETLESDCRQIGVELQAEVERHLPVLSGLKLSGVGLKKNTDTALECLEAHQRDVRVLLQCAAIRGVGAQVRCALPGRRQLARARLDDLVRLCELQREKAEAFFTVAEGRTCALHGRFSTDKTDGSQQARLTSRIGQSRRAVADMLDELNGLVRENLRRLEIQQAQGARLQTYLVERGSKGEPIRLCYLMAGAAEKA